MLDDSDDIHPLFHGAPKTAEFKKLRKRIIRETREAIQRYGMIERGSRRAEGTQPDKWLVCLSGGKDSYTLLAALTELKWRGQQDRGGKDDLGLADPDRAKRQQRKDRQEFDAGQRAANAAGKPVHRGGRRNTHRHTLCLTPSPGERNGNVAEKG